MKRTVLFLMAVIFGLSFTACGPHMYKTMSGGKDEAAYIIVLKESDAFYNNKVTVVVDGKEYPYGQVYKVKAKRKAHPVVITPGRHNVKVAVEGTVVTDENIFIGLQETKTVVLK